jgi:hypothetical protein
MATSDFDHLSVIAWVIDLSIGLGAATTDLEVPAIFRY